MKKQDEASGRERVAAGALSFGFAIARAMAPNPQLRKYPSDMSRMLFSHALFGDKNITNRTAQQLGYDAPFAEEPEKEKRKDSCSCVIL